MAVLSENEWLKLTQMILRINTLRSDSEIRTAFMEQLAELIPFYSGTFLLGRNERKDKELHAPVFFSRTAPRQKMETAEREYEKYASADYAKWLFSQSVSTVYRDTDLLKAELRESSDVYQKVFLPLGVHFAAGMIIVHSSVFLGTLTLFRRRSDGDFTDRDLFILETLCPHIENRIFQVHPQGLENREAVQRRQSLAVAYGLTERELEVACLLAAGASNTELSQRLYISEETVKKHLTHIYKKTGVSNRSGLLMKLFSV